ncbi:bax inhibitor 1-like [Dysidea avara]|uniref:bax inhibitor 1-like n=1 Tax=Dysidea avara TaxID=196820 RepID=UPI0033321BEF
MDNLFGGRNRFSMKALTNFSQLSDQARRHLKNVYGTLSLSLLSALAGAVLYFISSIAGQFLGVIGSFASLIWLMATPYNEKNQPKRLGIMCTFGLFSGMTLGPALDFAIAVDPSIVPTAFLSTAVIFTSFTLVALWTQRRSLLYLGGSLLAGLNLLLLAGFINLFLGSYFILQFQLYFGLMVFCVFVMYDTQLIVEKFEHGDKDYIWHSVELFIDFIAIFRRLLIILASKEKKSKK